MRRQVDETTRAGIDDQRKIARVRDARDLRFRDIGAEARDLVVARMHLHQRGGVGADRAFVIRRVGAVGRADFDEPRARAAHHVGHAERAANLDQFAARHHFLVVHKRREHEQHRRRVVVHDRRGLRAVSSTSTASTRLSRSPRQQRVAEIGVQHGAGEIEHAPQREGLARCEPRIDLGDGSAPVAGDERIDLRHAQQAINLGKLASGLVRSRGEK